jgi:pimeloyl-ACP methyl ester carboxylesterase
MPGTVDDVDLPLLLGTLWRGPVSQAPTQSRHLTVPHGLHVREVGPTAPAVPTVLLVHGVLDTADSFGAVVAQLPDLHIVLFDRRGWGRSALSSPPGSTSVDHADDVAAIIGARRATVIGHSVGGVVAMHAAIRHPELVASLGVFEPAVHWADWWTDEANAVVRAAASDALASAQAPGDITAEMAAEQRAYCNDLASVLSPPFNLMDITTPIMIGYGTRTDGPHLVSARRLAETLGAELFPIEGARHSAHRTHPKDFARFVRAVAGQAGHSQPR